MTNDLASLNGHPRQFLRVDGEAYAIHPLTLDELGSLQSWVDAQYRDPMDVVSACLGSGRFNPAQERYLMAQALELASRPRALIGTPEADQLIRSAEGIKQVLIKSIAKGRPGFGPAEAAALFAKVTPGDIQAAMVASGVEAVTGPAEGEAEGADPKAAGPPSTGGASITSA